MSLFEEASELLSTGRIYLVDTETGDYRGFPAAQYEVIRDLTRCGRFIPKMSESAARDAAVRILMKLLAGKN